jgi:hypothetical protein
MHVRIRYANRDGNGRPVFDSYVKEYDDSMGVQGALRNLMAEGFTRKASENYWPDEEEVIAPSAILSVTPCNERGYTKHFLAQMKKRQEQG